MCAKEAEPAITRVVQPLRVLRVSERVPPLPGGKEIHVSELTHQQVLRGDEVHLVHRYGDGAAVGATSVSRISFTPRLSGSLGAAVLALLAATRRRSRLPSVDVIHLHGDFTEVPALVRLGRRLGVPVVLTVHGRMNPRHRAVSRWALKDVDHVIALGDQVAGDLAERGVAHDKLSVMSSGLATDLLDVAALDYEVQPGLIVSVGSLDSVKNHERTIRAVLEQPPGSPARLVIIGDGPERGKLEALTSGSDRVTLLGQLSRPEVYAHVARAQVFVIASKPTASKGEGIPTALLEAMYLGRHCLVSHGALPQPVVTDNTSYESFDPDGDGLTELVDRAMDDPQRSAAFGRAAHGAVDGLDWPAVAGRVRAILLSTIRESRR